MNVGGEWVGYLHLEDGGVVAWGNRLQIGDWRKRENVARAKIEKVKVGKVKVGRAKVGRARVGRAKVGKEIAVVGRYM